MHHGLIRRWNFLVESEIFSTNTKTILTLENTATAGIFTDLPNPAIFILEYVFSTKKEP